MKLSTFRTSSNQKKGTKSSPSPVLQMPCTDVYPSQDFKMKLQSIATSAIFLKSVIWQPNTRGKISITFGDTKCSGCSPGAAWSHLGSNSTKEYPSMNLGFIDPPFENFEYKGK